MIRLSIHALMPFNATKLFAFSMHGTHTHTEWMQQVLSRPGWRIFYVPLYQHSNHKFKFSPHFAKFQIKFHECYYECKTRERMAIIDFKHDFELKQT